MQRNVLWGNLEQRAARWRVRVFLILAVFLVLGATPASAQTAFKPLSSVWCSNAGAVFATGMEGAIYRFDGSNWSKMVTPTTRELRDIWGTSASNIWTVGTYGTIIHYNGSSWSTVSSGTVYDLNGIWGSSANDIYAVGDHGTVLHYDGTSWSQLSGFPAISNQLNEVWGTASNRVWIWSSADSSELDPIYYQYDGASWSEVTFPDNSSGDIWVNAIWLNPTGHMFAAGTDAKVMRDDSVTWTDIMDSAGSATLNALWGSADDNLYAVGHAGQVLRFDGASWSNKADGTWSVSYVDIDGTSASDIFAVGYDYPTQTGRVLRYNGTSWITYTQTSESGNVDPVDPEDPSDIMPFVHTIATTGSCYDVEVNGNYAYLGWGPGGISVQDVSDPRQPTHLSGVNLYGGYSLDMGVDGWLYVGGTYGVLRFNFTQPDHFPVPQYINNHATTRTVHVDDEAVCFLTDYSFGVSGISAIDGSGNSGVTIPLNGQFNYEMAVLNNLAYVFEDNENGKHDLLAIDITNPASPVNLGKVGEVTNPQAMLIVGKRLYISENISTLTIFDLTDPLAPTLVKRIDLATHDLGLIRSMASLGGQRLLLGTAKAMVAMDASYPDNPQILARTDLETGLGVPVSVTVIGDVAYCGFFEDGLRVLDVANVVTAAGGDSDSGGNTPDDGNETGGGNGSSNASGGSGGGCAMAPGTGLGLEWLLLGLAVILTRLRRN